MSEFCLLFQSIIVVSKFVFFFSSKTIDWKRTWLNKFLNFLWCFLWVQRKREVWFHGFRLRKHFITNLCQNEGQTDAVKGITLTCIEFSLKKLILFNSCTHFSPEAYHLGRIKNSVLIIFVNSLCPTGSDAVFFLSQLQFMQFNFSLKKKKHKPRTILWSLIYFLSCFLIACLLNL